MKLRNTRERLAMNCKVWRANILRGLQQASPNEADILKRIIADLVLIEIALQKPELNEIEIDYAFPEASRIIKPGLRKRRSMMQSLWLPPVK